jgi:hypothetical protein
LEVFVANYFLVVENLACIIFAPGGVELFANPFAIYLETASFMKSPCPRGIANFLVDNKATNHNRIWSPKHE